MILWFYLCGWPCVYVCVHHVVYMSSVCMCPLGIPAQLILVGPVDMGLRQPHLSWAARSAGLPWHTELFLSARITMPCSVCCMPFKTKRPELDLECNSWNASLYSVVRSEQHLCTDLQIHCWIYTCKTTICSWKLCIIFCTEIHLSTFAPLVGLLN